MSTVPPRQRGTASGINTMVGNTGQMLSIAIAFPLVLSRIPEDVMFKVFLYGGGMGDVPEALHAFEQGLHQAFLVSFGITLVAALGLAPRAQPARAGRPAGRVRWPLGRWAPLGGAGCPQLSDLLPRLGGLAIGRLAAAHGHSPGWCST
jgi:hypothetical protein